MPRFRLSPQERRAGPQEQQQDSGMQDQTAMLQQLQAILGIQNQQQLAPEQLHALRSENTQRDLQSQYYGSNATAQQRLQNAEASKMEQFDPSKLSIHDILDYELKTGKPLPDELLPHAPAEYQLGRAHGKQESMNADLTAQGVNERQQQGLTEGFMGPISPNVKPEVKPSAGAGAALGSAGHGLLHTIAHMPEYLQHQEDKMTEGGSNFWGNLLGIKPQPQQAPQPTIKGRAWPWQPYTSVPNPTYK